MKKLTFLFLSAILIFSCSKKNSDPVCTKDVASISGTYKILAITYRSSASAAEEDLLGPQDDCDKDNTYTFQANGSYQLKDVGIVCSPSSEDSGFWSLSGDTFVLDGYPFSVENFDCRTLTISDTDTQTGEKLKIVLTRQ